MEAVRKVGKAGVVVQTRSKEDHLKETPLVALRNVDSDPDLAEILPLLHEQNLLDDAKWTLAKMKESYRVALKKGREGSRTNLVLGCAPQLRTACVYTWGGTS